MSETKIFFLMEDWISRALLPITYSSEIATLPAINLKDDDPALPLQTSGTTLDITIDASTLPQPWGPLALFIQNHNLTQDATIHFKANALDAWGAPTVDVTLPLAALIDFYDYRANPRLFNKFCIPLKDGSTTTFSLNWIRISISDATNPDGYLRFGIISIGPVGGEKNPRWTFAQNTSDPSRLTEALDGSTYTQQRGTGESIILDFDKVDLDMLARLRRWVDEGGQQRARWVALSPNQNTELEAATLTWYGTLTELPAFSEYTKVVSAPVATQKGLYDLRFRFDEIAHHPRTTLFANYTTYDGFITDAERTNVFDALLQPRETVATWTLDASATYWAVYPVNSAEYWSVWNVYEDGIRLDPAATLVACKATAGTWFFDISVERKIYVHATDGADPDTHVIHVAPLMAFRNAIAPSLIFPILTIPTTYNSTINQNVYFNPRLTTAGLSEINWEMDSAYLGFAKPQLSRIELINRPTQYSDTSGPFNKYVDRFQWKNTEVVLLHSDGGTVLTFPATITSASTEFAHMGRFVVRSVSLTDDKFIIEIDSQISELNKKIPSDYYTETYENEEDSGA